MRHVPKKLTDCPENLRESIDWLIQVRYGSGDGKGLTKLSEALKKLIEEAINNANTSLTTREQQLKCPTISSAGNGDYYCKKQDDEIKKHEKDIESKSSNKTDQTKNEIDELKAKIEKLKASKNDCAKTHYISEEERQKGLDEVEQQREIVGKLKTFTKELETKPNNILTHLCDGLQTFLGYDKSSKGYDGTGIVYSDLDRLCDGVMGFLSGVLSNIKDHLGQHKEQITSAINTLEQNKHAGKKGFNAAIAEVVKGVGRYNESVRKQNDHIKNKITDLDSQMKKMKIKVSETLGKYVVSGVRKIEHGAVDEADYLAKSCIQNADAFNTNLSIDKLTIKNAINDLNFNLRDNVNKARESIMLETKHFTALSAKEKRDIDEMTEKITNVLTNLGSCVNREIKNNVTRLVNDMKERVTQIKEKLESINVELRTYAQKLQAWIEKVEPFIVSGLEKVKTILAEVNWQDSSKTPMQVEEIVKQIKVEAMVLCGAGQNAKDVAREKVTAALEQVKAMDEALRKDLWKVKKQIKEEIWNHVNKEIVSKHFNKLEKNVREGLWDIEQKITSPVSALVIAAQGFFTKFDATKKAVDEAIGIVKADLDKFQDLDNFDKIDTKLSDDAKLLKALKERNAFSGIQSYFTQLDENIMQKIKGAITKIGQGMHKSSLDISRFEMEVGLRNAAEDLRALQNIINGNGNQLPDISKLKIGDQDIRGLTKLELTRKLTGATAIQNFVDKLQPGPKSAVHISRSEALNIFVTLGEIAQAVSSHSAKVVAAVMDQIKNNLKTAINSVVGVINNKVDEIKKGVTNGEEGGIAVTYSDGSQHKDARGLQALVNNFNKHIKQKLEELQSTVIPQAFNKKGPQDYGDGTKNYDFNHIMKTFKTAYDDINFELQERKFQGVVDEILNTEVGQNDLPTSGAANKISDVARKNFREYIKQIVRDNLSLSAEQLQGDLPENIIEINTQVKKALEKIEELKGAIEAHGDDAITKLDGLCNNIIDAALSGRNRDGLQLKLTELKDTYFKHFTEGKQDAQHSIRSIQHHLNVFQEELQNGPIRSAADFIAEGPKMCERTVSTLNRHVVTQVNDVKKELKHKANEAYVTTTQLLLTHFADRVTAHLKGLPEAIENDKHTGFKGFMEAFEGKPEVKPREKWAIHVARDEPSKLDAFRSAVTRKQASKKDEFKTLSEEFKKWYNPLNTYLIGELKRQHTETMSNRNPSVQVADSDPIPHTKNLGDLKGKLDAILEHLHDIPEARKYLFDNNFCTKLNTLQSSLDSIRPASYADESNPLLECLKMGIRGMCEELDKAYVSVYDGETFGANLVEKEKLTPYGTQLAKVFMSIFEMMHEDLGYLKNQCISKWHNSRIYSGSSMGTFLSNCGYTISNHDSHQNGELSNKAECDGKHIYSTLVGGFSHVYNTREDTKNAFQNLYDYLPTYYRVCQLPTFSSTRRPCSIYEMLRWLSGLPYNAVYLDLMSDDFADLFDKPKEAKTESISIDGISLEDQTPNTLNAYPQKIKRRDLHDAITHITSLAPTVLTTVVGYGDAYSTYAVDYYCNAPSFVYPSSAADCLNLIIEYLRKMFPVLRYLHSRCSTLASDFGWSQCRYGRGVAAASWQCNDHSKTNVDCVSRSPLMSYLNDTLPGHIPHQLVTVGCKSECKTCPSRPNGMPCLPPLGFRGFSGSKRTGKDISNVLTKFFANPHLTSLFCVVPRPPSTLPEHYGFALSFAKGWNNDMSPLILRWVKDCITQQSIALYSDPTELTSALGNAYCNRHGDKHQRHPLAESADLSSMSMTKSCLYADTDDLHCAPYLYALCSDTYHLLAERHCNLYLSWAVYLPWKLYEYLEGLRAAFQNIFCQDWGCSKCLNSDKCKRGKHGTDHGCRCGSVVKCRGVLGTLYKYGFTFADSRILLDNNGIRYCHDFYKQMTNVLNSKCFKTLFEKCDNFLFTIRAPFLWMNVALWSLSLFYLICVMVGRLDVLHIRSHLRIPSSHKITAQSLLAAAQVGRLAKISYLQP